ncbi:putative metalloprotease CJM1_0395 family protein [Neptuniibacter halophilus]|uniref:putative metalloprotease CJM1_0395 family protein n=1 Tax=Neptuniibacter halophilus TaxID=651666 RepID=UPI002574885A|nr:putative metalloprotease CJM1_0395 family protein [Neptuniibacter halophilus]
MQIFSAASSQALNSSAAPQELRSRDLQRLFSTANAVPVEQELQSSRNFVNRDRVTLSAAATELSRLAINDPTPLKRDDGELVGLESNDAELVGLESPVAGSAGAKASAEAEEQQELEITRELAKRDREVRAHEQTHAAIGGQYASAPSYSYERGPDGRLYAVAGEVKIDTSPIPNDPQATLEKAEIIQRAALSVAEPSSADRAAAAEARVMAIEARAEILQMEEEARAEQSADRVNESEQEDADDDSPTAGERLQALRDERSARSEGAAEALNEFNDRLNDLNKQLAEINKKLVDAGVFQKLFPEGSLLDQQV